MPKITYKFEEQELKELGEFGRNSEGKLTIILNATNFEDVRQKVKDLGNLNNAEIYLDGKKTNYANLYSFLMKD